MILKHRDDWLASWGTGKGIILDSGERLQESLGISLSKNKPPYPTPRKHLIRDPFKILYHPCYKSWTHLVSSVENSEYLTRTLGTTREIFICREWRDDRTGFWVMLEEIGLPQHHRCYYIGVDWVDALKNRLINKYNTKWYNYQTITGDNT